MKEIIFLALAFLTMNAQSQVLNGMLFNANYWRNFDWGNVKQSVLWTVPSLVPYVPASNQVDNGNAPKALKYSVSNLEGVAFVFTLAYDGEDFANGYFRTIFNKSKFDDCKAVSDKIANSYGVTGEFIDNSYKFNANSGLQRHVYQWDLGKSIATLNCTYLNGDKKVESVVLINKPLSDENKYEKIINLSCQRSSKYVAIYETSWTTMEPLIISVVPHENALLDSDGELLGKVDISKSTIRFEGKHKNSNVVTTINRIDGRLSAIQTELGTGKQLFEIQGNCNIRNPKERKF